MRRLPRWTTLVAHCALLLATPARAQDAGDDADTSGADAGSSPAAVSIAREQGCMAERFVMLAFAPDVDTEFAGEVHTDLAAELAPRGLALCSAGSTTREPAAVVQVSVSQSVAMIELDDRLTHKRVERDLALGTLPHNGRALATAIAIDELLRASWAELTLERERQSAQEQPQREPAPVPAAREPAAEAPPAFRRVRLELGAHAGFARTSEDFNVFSLHARATVRPGHAWLSLSVGPLLSLPTTTPLGEARARGVSGTLTLGACSDSSARVFACGGARGGLDWLRFHAESALAASRRDQTLLAHVSGVALLAGRVSPRISLFGEFALGALTRGARITDGTTPLAEVTGMLMGLQVGVGVEL